MAQCTPKSFDLTGRAALITGAAAGTKFSALFFTSCRDEELAACIKTLL